VFPEGPGALAVSRSVGALCALRTSRSLRALWPAWSLRPRGGQGVPGGPPGLLVTPNEAIQRLCHPKEAEDWRPGLLGRRPSRTGGGGKRSPKAWRGGGRAKACDEWRVEIDWP
jgi:hypothetical protein